MRLTRGLKTTWLIMRHWRIVWTLLKTVPYVLAQIEVGKAVAKVTMEARND